MLKNALQEQLALGYIPYIGLNPGTILNEEAVRDVLKELGQEIHPVHKAFQLVKTKVDEWSKQKNV